MRCESDERATAFASGAGETHRLGTLWLDAGNHHQSESSAAKELLGCAEPVLAGARTHQDRTFFPEWTGDSTESIDPDRSFTLRDGGTAGGAKNRRRTTLRHPDSQPRARKTVSGKNRIEGIYSCRDRFCCPMCNWCGIGKPLLDQRSNGRIAVGHSSAEYPEQNPKARTIRLAAESFRIRREYWVRS